MIDKHNNILYLSSLMLVGLCRTHKHADYSPCLAVSYHRKRQFVKEKTGMFSVKIPLTFPLIFCRIQDTGASYPMDRTGNQIGFSNPLPLSWPKTRRGVSPGGWQSVSHCLRILQHSPFEWPNRKTAAVLFRGLLRFLMHET